MENPYENPMIMEDLDEFGWICMVYHGKNYDL